MPSGLGLGTTGLNRNGRLVIRAYRMLFFLTFAIVFFIAIYFASRHFLYSTFYPEPSGMPASVDGTMESKLQGLDLALKASAPDVMASLQPGLSEEQIAKIEAESGFRLTDDLKALYRWHNGSLPGARANLIPSYRFRPLEEAVRCRGEQQKQVAAAGFVNRCVYDLVAGYRTGWLPVIDGQDGVGFFFDPDRNGSPGSFFYFFAENHQLQFFPSIGNFAAGCTEAYNSGIYYRGKDGQITEDYSRSLSLWSRYASSSAR
jgi:cell wall assembly regulator SMI1